MSLLEIGQKIIPNELDTSNLAKKNQENTFTTNQKIQGQLELRKNGNVLKVGNVDNNNSCYMELFNGNDRRAYIGHTSSNSNTFEINNGNNEIKLAGGSVNVNNKKITGLANPTSNNDAANKAYVDGLAQGAAKTGQENTFTANQKLSNAILEIRRTNESLKIGGTGQDYPSWISFYNFNDRIAQVGKLSPSNNSFEINTGGNWLSLRSSLIKANNTRISDVRTPTEPNDVATKAYVDANAGGGLQTQVQDNRYQISQLSNRTTNLENKQLYYSGFTIQPGNWQSGQDRTVGNVGPNKNLVSYSIEFFSESFNYQYVSLCGNSIAGPGQMDICLRYNKSTGEIIARTNVSVDFSTSSRPNMVFKIFYITF